MGWATAISGGLQLASSLYGGSQAKKAAKAQGRAAQQGIDYSKGMYDQARGDFSPYLGLGQTLLRVL